MNTNILQERLVEFETMNELAKNKLQIDQTNHEMTKRQLQESMTLTSTSTTSRQQDDSNLSLNKLEEYQLAAELAEEKEAFTRQEMLFLRDQLQDLRSQLKTTTTSALLPETPKTNKNMSSPSLITPTQFLNMPSPTLISQSTRFDHPIDTLEDIPLSLLASMGDDPKQRAGRQRSNARATKGVTVKRQRHRLNSYYGAVGIQQLSPQLAFSTTTSAASATMSIAVPSSLDSADDKQTTGPPRRRRRRENNKKTKHKHKNGAEAWRGGGGALQDRQQKKITSRIKSAQDIAENLKNLNQAAKARLKRSTPSPKKIKKLRQQQQRRAQFGAVVTEQMTRRRTTAAAAAVQERRAVTARTTPRTIPWETVDGAGQEKEDEDEDVVGRVTEKKDVDVDVDVDEDDDFEIEILFEEDEDVMFDAVPLPLSNVLLPGVAPAVAPPISPGLMLLDESSSSDSNPMNDEIEKNEKYSEVELMLLEAEKIRQERRQKRSASTFSSSEFYDKTGSNEGQLI